MVSRNRAPRKVSQPRRRRPAASIESYLILEAQEGAGGGQETSQMEGEEEDQAGASDDDQFLTQGSDQSVGQSHREIDAAEKRARFENEVTVAEDRIRQLQGRDSGESYPEDEPYFPVELAIPGQDTWQFDFSRRLYDLPETLHFDLLTDQELEEPLQIASYDELDGIIRETLEKLPKYDHNLDENAADQLNKKEVFMDSGTPLKDRLVSGFAELDGNLDEVRLDSFENAMVYSAPTSSDASPQFTHGWPRRLIELAHGGFLAGNITCMSKVTNVRIRSMARGDVAAFVSTDEIRGSGLSLSELLYCRKVAIECNRESYRFPARLIDSSVRYGLNFATMGRLEPDDMQRLGQALFLPYWSNRIVGPHESDGSPSGSGSSPDEITTGEDVLLSVESRDIAGTLTAVHCTAAADLDVQQAVKNLCKNFTGARFSHRPRTQQVQRPSSDPAGSGDTSPSASGNKGDKSASNKTPRKRKGSAPASSAAANKRRQCETATALERQLPVPILDRLCGKLHYDKLPNEACLSKIFDFMKKHRPIALEEDLETASVRQSLDYSTTQELNGLWLACRRECTCVADASADSQGGCPVRSSDSPFDQTTETACPHVEECVPCTFVNKVRAVRVRQPLTLKLNKAQIFRQRLLLAEPLAQLIDHVETTVGVGKETSRDLKELARSFLGCEERMLLSVRKVGSLIKICPRLCEVRLKSGLGSFWETGEVIGRAVCCQEDDFLRQHALARIKLSLATMAAGDDASRQQLEDWFHYYSCADQEESRLWTEHLGTRDLWSAAEKLTQRPTADDEAACPSASALSANSPSPSPSPSSPAPTQTDH